MSFITKVRKWIWGGAGNHRSVDMELASGQRMDNVTYREIDSYIEMVKLGTEDFLILSSQDGYLQFYGVNDQFVAEMRVNLHGDDFRTYSFIVPDKERCLERTKLNTPYGQFTPTEREVLPLTLLKTVVKNYYDNIDTEEFLKSVSYVDTTEDTKRYMGLV